MIPDRHSSGRGHPRPALAATLVAAGLFLGQPAFADNPDLCDGPLSDAAAYFQQAEAMGFVAVSEPAGAIVDRLSWLVAMPYLVADSGGETLDRILELQRKSAANLITRADVPGSASRVFRESDKVLQINWVQVTEDQFLVRCTLGDFGPDTPQPSGIQMRFGSFSAEIAPVTADGIRKKTERFVPDHPALRSTSPDAQPPAQITTVELRYSSEVFK